jgi:hypothetical protein
MADHATTNAASWKFRLDDFRVIAPFVTKS